VRDVVDAFIASSLEGFARLGWERTLFGRGEDLQSFAKLSRTMEHGLTVYPDLADGSVAVFASVGISHPTLSRLASEFYQLPVSSVFGASVSDLLTEAGLDGNPYRRWAIRSLAEVDMVVARLCGDVATFAERYLASFSSIPDLIDPLANDKGPLASGHLILAYALTGRWPEALDALARHASRALGERPPMSTQSWRFIRSFVRHYEISPQSLPFEIPPA
jgi:hypothetical protein